MKKLNAMLANVDPKVAEAIQEAMRVIDLESGNQVTANANMIKTLMSEIDALKTRIVELEAAGRHGASDDKYGLTKAKLIRLMKDMGYYD